MKTISSLLERITKSLGKSTLLKESIISIVQEKTGALLLEKDISFKDGVLEITASPALKNELRMKEESIKGAVRNATGANIVRVLYK